MKLRTKVAATAAALLVAGGGAVLALDAAQAAPAPDGPSAAAQAAAGLEPGDVALVQKHLGWTLKANATARTLRAPGQAVKALVLAPGEDGGDGGKPFGHPLLVTRVDGASVDANKFVPHMQGQVLPTVDALIEVIDPETGGMVTTVYLTPGDTKGKSKLDVGRLGTPADVPVTPPGKS
jgi:hypothetical protein